MKNRHSAVLSNQVETQTHKFNQLGQLNTPKQAVSQPRVRPREYLLGVIAALLLLGLANTLFAATPAKQRPLQTFVGSVMDTDRASRLVHQQGLQLIDFHPCAEQSDRCTLLAVRQADGEAYVYQLSAEPCDEQGLICLGGFTIRTQFGVATRKPPASRPDESMMKVSAKPGEDGLPPDPQDEAQANATNEIIEALGDGKYDGNYDQFWDDLESIQNWENPSWQEPDPRPPTLDQVKVTGNNQSPAILISGRYKDDNGDKRCGSWVSTSSTSATLATSRNWLGNAIGDGCDSEVAVFSQNGAAVLSKPEKNWSKGADTLKFSLGPAIKVPTHVWVIKARKSYADEEQRLRSTEFQTANDILRNSRCGIELDPVVIHDRTSALTDPDQKLGCASIESILKPIGFQPGQMNVYIVNALISDKRAGVACTAESDNVIVLDQGRSNTALVHEYGHWFDLWHTDGKNMSKVNVNNVMSTKGLDNMFTAGQCYRASFSKDSYLNKQKLRDGRTKRCEHLQDADNQCPGVKNEF